MNIDLGSEFRASRGRCVGLFPSLTHDPTLHVEEAGHICLFLPRFHYELNPIEMLWGYAKYCMCIWYASHMRHTHSIICYPGYRNAADGGFPTAKRLVPQCLDSCELITI